MTTQEVIITLLRHEVTTPKVVSSDSIASTIALPSVLLLVWFVSLCCPQQLSLVTYNRSCMEKCYLVLVWRSQILLFVCGCPTHKHKRKKWSGYARLILYMTCKKDSSCVVATFSWIVTARWTKPQMKAPKEVPCCYQKKILLVGGFVT